MVSGATRTGGLVATAAAFVMAAARGGPSAWVIAGLSAGALTLLATILFIPSETPARRLRQLIQALRNPTGRTTRSGLAHTRGTSRRTPSD